MPEFLLLSVLSVAFGCARFPAVKAVELGTQLVLRRLTDLVAGLTFSERGFSSRYRLDP